MPSDHSTSPLQVQHENAQAEFQDYAGVPIVQTFGEPQAEYAAIHKSAAILDFPQRAYLELTGRDRLAFLNNLITNQTWDKQTKTPMPADSGLYAFFLNNKGRIVTDLLVIDLGDRTLLELDARNADATLAALEKYRFAEQVRIASKQGQLLKLFLTGPRAFDALLKTSGASCSAPGEMGVLRLTIAGVELVVCRDDFCGRPGYTLIVPGEALAAVWDAFTRDPGGTKPAEGGVEPAAAAFGAQFMKFGGLARPAGWAAFNTARIEAGRPIFGIDFDDSVLPAETGQFNRAVSVTKGCYLGQEIVARMHARNQVARLVVGFRMEADALPVAGVKIYDDAQNEIGGVTSSTLSPMLSNAAIGLGLVKRPYSAPGTVLHIPAEGAMRRATVVQAPFI